MSRATGAFAVSDADLEKIRLYLINVRDAVVSGSIAIAFPATTVIGSPTVANFTITLDNYRGLNLIYSLGISGAEDFTILSQSDAGTTCTDNLLTPAPAPAASGPVVPKSCNIKGRVKFDPQTGGPKAAKLHIKLVAASGADPIPIDTTPDKDIALSAMAVQPTPLFIMTPPIAMNARVGGPVGDEQEVTISNSSLATGPLTIGSLNSPNPFSGTALGDYSLVAALGSPGCAIDGSTTTVGIGADCKLRIRFKPTLKGPRNVTLTIPNNGGGVPVTLTGTGLQSTIGVSPPQIDFEQRALGAPATAPSQLQITNADEVTALNWSNPRFVIIDNGTTQASTEFTASNGSCSGASIGPLRSCSINIIFMPIGNIGTRTAILSIYTDASNNPLTVNLSGRAVTTPPNPSVTAQVAFADTVAGIESPETRIVTIENPRTNSLTYSVARTGVDASDFIVKFDACAGQIATNTTCKITLAFKPRTSAALGPRSADVQLTFAGTGGDPAPSPASVVLSGVAIAPLSLSTSRISPTAPLTRSSTAIVVLTNRGAAPITLASLAFQGSFAGDYALASTSQCMTGASIAPGASCDLIVSFTPGGTATGSRAAQLQITSDVIGSPQTLDLNGTATAMPQGKIGLDAQAIGFGDVPLQGTLVKLITVQNIGDAPLTFSGFMLGGSAASEYTRTGTCSTTPTLDVKAQCTLDVSFAPTQLGDRNAVLTIQSDASNSPSTISLTGRGIPAPAPVATLSQLPGKTLDFLDQTVGGLYPPRRVTLTNTGTADLASIVIAVEGAVFTNASAATCPVRLVAGTSCHIDIAFTPTAAGTDHAGTLRITSNAAGSPHTVALAGRGTTMVVPVLAWSTPTTRLNFGLVTVGTVAVTQSLTLVNQGPSGVTLSVLNAIGVDGASFPVTSTGCAPGQTLFAGQGCNIDVRFAPPTAGAKTAVVQVASTGSAPADVVLAGTGLGGVTPDLTLSTTALNFGVMRISAQSAPAEVTLSANGSGAVMISAIAVSGAYVMQNKTCPAVPFALLAGSLCTVSVTFVPGAEGAATGKLSITSDAAPAEREVSLSGQGEKPAELSSGGCSISDGTGSDPTLWALVLLAAAALYYRARVRRAAAARRQP